MNKNISWKMSLGIAAICYLLKFASGPYLPSVIIAAFEIVGLITLILGIIGGLKAVFNKGKNKQAPKE